MHRAFRGKTLFNVAIVGALGYTGIFWYQQKRRERNLLQLSCSLSAAEKRAALEWRPPTRNQLIDRLKGRDLEGGGSEFDLIIIGGGATGTGCAIDAASRGLKVALVERDDFSSGTSSKSTKLVHGGVRYLEKAFLRLDWEQFLMVQEALSERSIFLRLAPHLTEQIPIMLPIYKWHMIPYYWAGSKVYDLVAGGQGLENSYFLTKSKALQVFPMLKKESLVGAMVYYDGAQNDARTNVSLALTAIQQGATVTNYTEVIDLIKEKTDVNLTPQIRGVIVKDRITGEIFKIRSKGVVSATGPFCDIIRKMDDENCKNLVVPSVGSHVIFPSYFSPSNMGLIDPNTSDGRVIFFLPWEGNTIAGTTDAPSDVTFEPKASRTEVNFILQEVKKYLDPVVQVRYSDILAAWSGLRPLISNPKATSTQELVRNHIVFASPSGLLTIAGGKWTTYRRMAEDTIDAAIEHFKLRPKYQKSRTTSIPLIGSHMYNEKIYIRLIQQFGMETDVAKHLAKSYGDRSFIVAGLSESTGRRWPLYGNKIVPWYPYLESEVRYAARFEYAQTIVDVLARRTRLAHLSCHAAKDAIPRVAEIMAEELHWSSEETEVQKAKATEYLVTCGLEDIPHFRAEFGRQQVESYRNAFLSVHKTDKLWSRVNYKEAVNAWQSLLPKEKMDQPVNWQEVIKKSDPENIGTIGFSEFLDGMSFLRQIYQLDLNDSTKVEGLTDSNNLKL